MNILVTGSNGQVGSELQALAGAYPQFSFIFVDKKDLDIGHEEAVHAFFDTHNFDYCINCAAYTAVDQAESDTETAYLVNAMGAKNLATACKKHATRLFQISTDYVYHNHQNTPFKEQDATSPKSVYGRTKLEGEKLALGNHTETLILRTSWVYSSFGNNFVKTMIRLGNDRDQLGIIFDQIGSPTYARDLAKAMLDIINQNPKEFTGIYHYSNEGVCSWFDFATAIFELEKIDCQVNPIETKDYPTPAQRPHFSLLNKGKIKATFGLEIPYWRESLKACLELL